MEKLRLSADAGTEKVTLRLAVPFSLLLGGQDLTLTAGRVAGVPPVFGLFLNHYAFVADPPAPRRHNKARIFVSRTVEQSLHSRFLTALLSCLSVHLRQMSLSETAEFIYINYMNRDRCVYQQNGS